MCVLEGKESVTVQYTVLERVKSEVTASPGGSVLQEKERTNMKLNRDEMKDGAYKQMHIIISITGSPYSKVSFLPFFLFLHCI